MFFTIIAVRKPEINQKSYQVQDHIVSYMLQDALELEREHAICVVKSVNNNNNKLVVGLDLDMALKLSREICCVRGWKAWVEKE